MPLFKGKSLPFQAFRQPWKFECLQINVVQKRSFLFRIIKRSENRLNHDKITTYDQTTRKSTSVLQRQNSKLNTFGAINRNIRNQSNIIKNNQQCIGIPSKQSHLESTPSMSFNHLQMRQLFSGKFNLSDNGLISTTLKVLSIQQVYLKQEQSLKLYSHKLNCYSDQILTFAYVDSHYTPIQKICQGQNCKLTNFNSKISSQGVVLTSNKNSRIQVTDMEKIDNLGKFICDKNFMQAYSIQSDNQNCKTLAQIVNSCSQLKESQQFVKVYAQSMPEKSYIGCAKCKKSVCNGKCQYCGEVDVKKCNYYKAIIWDHTAKLQATIFQPQIHQKLKTSPQNSQVLIKLKSFTKRGCIPGYKFLNHCIIQISSITQTD